MADRLTQLQDALDQLTTQFYCTIRYVSTRHDTLPPHPALPKTKDENLIVDPPAVFAAAKYELARDIILKSKQIELLILALPGIGVSEDEQVERLRVLEGELEKAEGERRRAVEERERWMERLDTVIRAVRRV
ncbi:mediator complex, subunit Med21 [Peziza echinospora]|nr:mediator complex, subunit Med21 [Peziza echinospora]